jgi:hypothetical protein
MPERCINQSGQLGADGLWARLGGGAQRVVLLLADSRTGERRIGLLPPCPASFAERRACQCLRMVL